MTGPTLDLGRLGVWGHLDTLSVDDARDYVRRVEELGFGTLWVPETVGREPFTLLGLLAGLALLLLAVLVYFREEMAKLVHSEIAKWAKVVKDAGAKIDN